MQGGESREAQARWQDRPHQRWVHLVFLSARPESFKGLTEALSLRRIFHPLVKRGEMLGYPVLLLGSLRSGPRALWDYARGSRHAPFFLRILGYGELALCAIFPLVRRGGMLGPLRLGSRAL